MSVFKNNPRKSLSICPAAASAASAVLADMRGTCVCVAQKFPLGLNHADIMRSPSWLEDPDEATPPPCLVPDVPL